MQDGIIFARGFAPHRGAARVPPALPGALGPPPAAEDPPAQAPGPEDPPAQASAPAPTAGSYETSFRGCR